MPENHFGEDVAERYDESAAEMFEPAVLDPAVDFLAALAGDGAALELGIGTGRIALPLSERGVRVHGIDLSEAMVAKLRAKPGAERIEATIGDFATTRVDGRFSLGYIVFNTIGNLTTQDAQVACFENVAAHLEPGGCFVIEVGVPGLRRFRRASGSRSSTSARSTSASTSTTSTNQGLDLAPPLAGRGASGDCVSMPFRYVWPAELDLMARIAGMTLHERWSGWTREPFTSESTKHVSVWEKPA